MSKLEFPKNFLWGAATSSHQVEGGNRWNDWWDFEQKGRLEHSSEEACDHYCRFRKDFDIAKKLGMNAQRISIEWSRIEKEKGVFDKKEIEHYREVLKYLKDNDFTTFVTLHHFTNPLWFANEGGWANKKSVNYFTRYTEIIVEELSEYIDFWATINEPTVYGAMGYLIGEWVPKKRNPIKFLAVLNNMAKAHNKAYELIHKKIPEAKVGLVHNCAPLVPAFWIFNKLVFWGRNFFTLDNARYHLDYIGVNYYFPVVWYLKKKRIWRTDLKWPVYPLGLYTLLKSIYKRYHLPIYITENGLADHKDAHRERFIKLHLRYLHKAISEGVDVRGYFHWSLLDNFEWADGFDPRFGLVEVDYETQKRTVRESAKAYAKICKSNCLEQDS